MSLIANSIVTWYRTAAKKPSLDKAQAIVDGYARLCKDGPTKVADNATWTKAEAGAILKSFAVGDSVDILNILKSFPSYDGKTVKSV